MRWILLGSVIVGGLVAGAVGWHTVQPFAEVRSVALAARARPERLEQVVRTLVERFPTRHGGDPQVLDAAGAWLEGELVAEGSAPKRQTFSASGADRFNVLAHFGPEEGPRVVVGAHYDAHPKTPGADDDASGVAAVLELARLLRAQPPRCPVDRALWTLEEPPYFRTASMGSAHHAKQLKDAGQAVRFAVAVEMVGFYSDRDGSQRYPPNFPFSLAYPAEGNFALLLGTSDTAALTRRLKGAFLGAGGLPVASVNVSRTMAGADFSDHLNFWNEGYPAFLLTDTAFLRNERYHTPQDLPETLDYRRMALLVDGLAAAVLDGCAAP